MHFLSFVKCKKILTIEINLKYKKNTVFQAIKKCQLAKIYKQQKHAKNQRKTIKILKMKAQIFLKHLHINLK